MRTASSISGSVSGRISARVSAPAPHLPLMTNTIRCQLNYEPRFLPTRFDARFGDKSRGFVRRVNAGLTEYKAPALSAASAARKRQLTRRRWMFRTATTCYTGDRGLNFSTASKSMSVSRGGSEQTVSPELLQNI